MVVVPSAIGASLSITIDIGGQANMICFPCVPNLAALKRKVNYNEDPEIILVYVDYGLRTHT